MSREIIKRWAVELATWTTVLSVSIFSGTLLGHWLEGLDAGPANAAEYQLPSGGATIKYAYGNIAASQTDATLTVTATGTPMAATSGKKIRVLDYVAVAGGTATTLIFNSKGAGAGTAISSTKALAANGVAAAGEAAKGGHIETKSGENLTVTTGSGSTTGIDITYVEVND